ncbi:histidine phosphatase family protein [Corynebacterium tuberculostearicum]
MDPGNFGECSGEENGKCRVSGGEEVSRILLYCTPRLRAQETAQLAGFSDYQVTEDRAEWDYGQYEGKTRQDIIATIPDWQIWTHGAPGGETPEQVAARLTRFYNRMIDTGDERILGFAHGHALRVLAMT